VRRHNLPLHIVSVIGLFAGLTGFTGRALAQRQPPGQALFERSCAGCHSPKGGAPDIAALNTIATERIFEELMTGRMKDLAAGLTNRERRNVAEFLGKRPLNDPAAGDITKMTNQCSANPALGGIGVASWSGWGGGAANARFQTERAAGLKAADVPRLKLKWAFGLPGGSNMYSQPAVAFGRVFVGSDDGVVYSMNASSGCVYWAFRSDAFGRFRSHRRAHQGLPGHALRDLLRDPFHHRLCHRRARRQAALEGGGERRHQQSERQRGLA
jgi:cytochrome c553